MKTPFAALLLTACSLLLSTSAFAQPFQPKSGLLLGIYAQGTGSGLKVTGFIPGYSAQEVLRRGDRITAVATDDLGLFDIYNLYDFENAKEAVGPNRWAAIEYYRPGFGFDYAWVEFRPVGNPAIAAAGAPMQMRAEFRTEKQRPGAKETFARVRSNTQGGSIQVQPLPEPPRGGRPIVRPGRSGNAADLFRNRR